MDYATRGVFPSTATGYSDCRRRTRAAGRSQFLPVADARGVNFGWPQYEGDLVFDNTRPGRTPRSFPCSSMITARDVVRSSAVMWCTTSTYPLSTGAISMATPAPVRSAALFRVRPGRRRLGDRRLSISLPGLSSFGAGFPRPNLYRADQRACEPLGAALIRMRRARSIVIADRARPGLESRRRVATPVWIWFGTGAVPQ